MSTTAADKPIPIKQWVDVNAGAIARILVQNKTGHPVLVATGPAAPGSLRGMELLPGQFITFENEANIWCYSEWGGIVHCGQVG